MGNNLNLTTQSSDILLKLKLFKTKFYKMSTNHTEDTLNADTFVFEALTAVTQQRISYKSRK